VPRKTIIPQKPLPAPVFVHRSASGGLRKVYFDYFYIGFFIAII
jgi:hypothetical protein